MLGQDQKNFIATSGKSLHVLSLQAELTVSLLEFMECLFLLRNAVSLSYIIAKDMTREVAVALFLTLEKNVDTMTYQRNANINRTQNCLSRLLAKQFGHFLKPGAD